MSFLVHRECNSHTEVAHQKEERNFVIYYSGLQAQQLLPFVEKITITSLQKPINAKEQKARFCCLTTAN